jgi:hypothetical protein
VRRLGFALVLLLLTAACTRGATGQFVEPRVVSVPLAGQSAATLTLASGATTVGVHAADLGDRLYVAGTPANSGVVPRGTGTDLRLVPSNEPGSGAAVDLKVSTKVVWNLRLAGGATTETVDLRGAKLGSLAVTAGVSQLEIWLPVPTADTTIQVSGGASGVRLHVPAGVSTRVSARSGAGSVTIDGITHAGVGAGAVWAPDDWGGQQKHYDVDVSAGVGWLTLDRI